MREPQFYFEKKIDNFKKHTGIRFLLLNSETEWRKSSGDFCLNTSAGTKKRAG
jgi:hypothetical protein